MLSVPEIRSAYLGRIRRGHARHRGRLDNDFESWGANPRSKYDFLYFLDHVAQPSKGDVH